jgi:hypothetical protein
VPGVSYGRGGPRVYMGCGGILVVLAVVALLAYAWWPYLLAILALGAVLRASVAARRL